MLFTYLTIQPPESSMRSKQSKAERVKEVKQVLAKFSVDITQLHLAVHSSTIDMSGVLLKYSGDEFNVGELSSLVDALAGYGH
ncbi:MAG: hypothetical protein KC478_16605, partial [Bacteriovoracaceae bacterium]|nr:hypothetical protein [Bacteriovoracaceae bacterium]